MPIRLCLLSDLHVEKGPYTPPPLDADLIVLAGDVGWGPEGIQWIAQHLHGRPVAYVAGNREYWHWPEGTDPLAALKERAAQVPGLDFLADSQAVYQFDGGRRLRVLGATLWTDYGLEGDAPTAMAAAQARMPDYRNGRGADGLALTPDQVLAWNHASVAFLSDALARPFDGVTVVVTHHCPSACSIKAPRPGHVPTIASVNRLDGLMERHAPALWVHGHSHWSCDYRIGTTRVVSNQRGEPENDAFAPLFLQL